MSLVQIQLPQIELDGGGPVPKFHIVGGKHQLLFVVNGSRLYSAEAPTDDGAIDLSSHAPQLQPMAEPAALSLNIAQSCNLACSYCYADEGRFGGTAQLMSLETALQAIRYHIRKVQNRPLTVGFIGGEPLLNRPVLHAATKFAVREAAAHGAAVTFGITTNATLLRQEDIDLLRSYSFAVSVSIDGARELHDSLRPSTHGAGSFDRAIAGISPLLARPGKAWVAARVTVTRQNLDVPSHVEALSKAGFTEIGVSPMRTGPNPELRITGRDWQEYLDAMRLAAQNDWDLARSTGGRLRLTNFSTALRQIYRGACAALPCGAAANYLSLSADGQYYTCHRAVGDDDLQMGDIQTGPSLERRLAFVQERAVDRQEPCRRCWARYLCGGGCHTEVIRAGREGCDFIRGWLEYCISIYPEVLAERPDLLETGQSEFSASNPPTEVGEAIR